EGEKLKQMELIEQAELEESAPSGKLALGAKNQPKTPDPKAAKNGKDPAAPVETGLSKLVMQVDVTGDYPNYINLVRKLEGYERVVGIDQVVVAVPMEK